MRWRAELRANMVSQAIIITLLAICTLHTCDGVRRPAQRRKDVAPEAGLYVPSPSAESLQAIAQAMGAAGFETYTEGKALVKRLIPADSQPDLDVVEHQGVIGKAGVDFPALPNIPNTGFNCKNVPTGYYADLETDCQVFHICDTSRKISFLCPNGTIFSQSHLICDWWFKVDCASAPALYESSVEYYSNEQKKSQKISASLSKNSDLQQIGTDTNVRAESRRTPVNVPSTTERLLRHRQRLQNDAPPTTAKATSRNFQALFDINPTQRTQATTAFEKRRKNLVQLIANNFGNVPSRTTAPAFDYTTRRTTVPVGDYNSIREMQVAAETASFAQNQNRQYFQDFNNKNYRPYPVYNPNPNLTAKPNKPKSNPTLTTLYDIRDKHLIQYTPEATSKRSTLVPYSKSYTTINSKHEPYTRPGVSLLKDFLEKEKNKSLATTTENLAEVTPRSDILENYEKSSNKVTIESKSNFESVTKIPLTTRNDKFTDTASTDRFDSYSTNQVPELTTEPSYQERRERLVKKLNLDVYGPTQATNEGVLTEKYYGDQPNRPGLIVPPSLTPKTLHSLAIYYATALDNLSTTSPPDENDSTTPAFDEYEPIEDGLPALFSRQTINKYSSLFGQGGDSELLEELRLDPNGTYNELAEDLSVQMSQNPLATSPQIRELAQVFTHALSAYLQDPVQFRKVLSDIRPTHPSFGDMLTATEEPSNTEPTTTVNEDDEEILGFSDDHKTQHHVNSIRDSKALNIGADYTIIDDPTTTARPSITTNPTTTTEIIPSYSTTFRTPFRCCGRISASYTTAPPPRAALTTQQPFSYTVPPNVNVQTDNPSVSVTTDNYKFPRFGGFQNNKLTIENTAYGIETTPTESKPLNDYVEVTNLPTAWGVDTSESTVAPSAPAFESKKIRTTTSTFPTTTPVYFTETDSVELENEEELQRAHSQSFIAPNNNSIRQGKQLNIEDKTVVKKPSEDLEAPTLPNDETTTVQTTTTTQPTTTIRDQTESLTTVSPVLSSIFTSPDSEKTTNDFQWPTTYENWQSTFVDPITLNDGLSPSGNEKGLSQIAHQTNTWAFNTATTPTVQYTTTDPVPSSTINIANVEISTPGGHRDDRTGRLLRDPTSTEAAQDFTTISDTVVEKAKEIMGGMNATTTQKLMNVMKKTKSKTVKRLILLLVQTCDDDHNSTAEASKKALLEALMAVSQKDMDEIAQEEGLGDTLTTASDTEIKTTVYQRRMDRIPARESFRRGKSLNVDPKAINSLSNPTTTEALKTEETESTTTLSPRTTIRGRGGKRHQAKPTEAPRTPIDRPFAEARVAPQGADVKTQSDTRAIELLRSLYTIAARWG